MVPVKEAISSGAWLFCEYTYQNNTYQFRVKVMSFKKLDLNEVDRQENIKINDDNCEIWLLGIEILNLMKEPVSSYKITNVLLLTDQDEYKFDKFDDSHLNCFSEYSKKSGINRFYGNDLLPKIKAVGAIPFVLPIDDEAIYSLSLKYNGIIREA